MILYKKLKTKGIRQPKHPAINVEPTLLIWIRLIRQDRALFLQASRKWRENTLDLSRQKVSAQLSAMNAATAQIVTLTGVDDTDHAAVGASVNQM